MAARNIPINLRAICALIALFSTGLLQPIDCWSLEAKSSDTPRFDEIKNVAKLIKNPDTAEVCNISVRKVLSLMVDCKPEVLAEKEKYFSSAVPEMQQNCESLYFEIFGSCLDRFVNLHDPYLGQYMNEDDKEFLLQLHKFFSMRFSMRDPEQYLYFFTWKLEYYKKQKCSGTKAEDELDRRVQFVCRKTDGFLKVYAYRPLKSVNVPLKNDKIKLWDEIDDLCRAHAEYLKAKKSPLANRV